MREWKPKITIGVLIEFERLTGIRVFENPGAIISGIDSSSTLLWCSVKAEYPRLSREKFLADLQPEELGAAIDALAKEMEAFFLRFKGETPAEATNR